MKYSILFLAAVMVIPACGPDSGTGMMAGTDGGVVITGPQLPDEDHDGISDEDEGRASNRDSDGDGTPDYKDPDSDNDGIPDSVESGTHGDDRAHPIDSDADGKPDFIDTDSDGNGRPDKLEGATTDTDGDAIPDYRDPDDDNDGIPDKAEIGMNTTLPDDTDGDSIPDYQDTDSDNDGILDAQEGINDIDTDGIPNYLDIDSDGDGRPDTLEAGDADPTTPAIDTDHDGVPDYLDIDADNDGLLDKNEDRNGNGMVDPGETSAIKIDSDGDGVSDLIEVTAMTDPTNPADNPRAKGNFVFLEPYARPADPARDTLDFATTVSKADVFFSIDVTGSMQPAITALRNSITSTIVPAIRTGIPNTGFGLANFRDFQPSAGGAGSVGDVPFTLMHRIMTTNTAAGQSSLLGAFNDGRMNAVGGGDGPESGYESLMQIVNGAGNSTGGVPAWNPGQAFPTATPAGEETNRDPLTSKGVGWRVGALPIVLQVTDATSHDDYSFGAHRAAAVAALQARGMRVIGVYVATAQTVPGARDQLVSLASDTGAHVPPTAWDAARPAGCGAGQCCTGQNGAGVAPTGGQCNLVFDVNGLGGGLSTSIVQGIQVLTQSGTLSVSAVPEDDPSDAVDAVGAFIADIVPNPNAPAPCTHGGPNASVVGKVFVNVSPGYKVCFDVVPKMNASVMAKPTPQVFKAFIKVLGDNVTELSRRDVFFLVPPEIPLPRIN